MGSSFTTRGPGGIRLYRVSSWWVGVGVGVGMKNGGVSTGVWTLPLIFVCVGVGRRFPTLPHLSLIHI